MKFRASSRSIRCWGVALNAWIATVHALEEVADIDPERLRDIVQTASSDAVDALLILVGLLIGDADQLGHLLLGEPEHDPALAHARTDMAVDVLRT